MRARYLWREKLEAEPRAISFAIKVKPCDDDYFAELPDIILPTGLHLPDLYCLSDDQAVLPEEFQDMLIRGRFDSENQGKLSITIEKCKLDCEDDHIINEFLKKSNVAVYFVNYGQNLGSYSHPFRQNLAGLFTGVDPQFSKTHEIFMKEASVTTDSGVAYPTVSQQSYFLMDSQRESVSQNEEGSLYQLEVQMGTTQDFHDRKYPRIFGIIAQIGGYIKAFLLLLYLYKPFLKRMYYIELINHLYKVDGGERLQKTNLDDSRSENGEKLITWRKFDFFGFGKKDEDDESVSSNEENQRKGNLVRVSSKIIIGH